MLQYILKCQNHQETIFLVFITSSPVGKTAKVTFKIQVDLLWQFCCATLWYIPFYFRSILFDLVIQEYWLLVIHSCIHSYIISFMYVVIHVFINSGNHPSISQAKVGYDLGIFWVLKVWWKSRIVHKYLGIIGLVLWLKYFIRNVVHEIWLIIRSEA